MRVFTNEPLIIKRKKMAGILSPISMGLLLGGLALNFWVSGQGATVPQIYVYAMFGCLLLGFVSATISSGLVTRWVKEPRSDQILSQTLKGFDSKSALFNYTTDVPHVLVTQNKIYAITPKLQDGEIEVENNRWKRKFTFSRLLRVFADEGLGNPTFEAEQNAQKLAKFIQQHLSAGEKVAIEPVIVFTDPKVNLTIKNTQIPVMNPGKFKNYVRQSAQGAAMRADVRDKLINALANGISG